MQKREFSLAALLLTCCHPIVEEEPTPVEQVAPAPFVPPPQVSEGVRQRMQQHGYWPAGEEPSPGSTSTTATEMPLRAPPSERWAHIEAGKFQMGSPPEEAGRFEIERQHHVTLTRDFLLQTTEVTNGQWLEVMGRAHGDGSCTQCPVERVPWAQAVAFVNKMSEAEGLPHCYGGSGAVTGGDTVYECSGYRLPTEAEWEYAARAGTTTARYGELDEVAWYYENSGESAHPVGQKQPNAWGLYDMYGNVWEWTSDWYGDYGGEAIVNPTGPETGQRRISRGGSWDYCSKSMRAAFRHIGIENDRFCVIGFRPARTLP